MTRHYEGKRGYEYLRIDLSRRIAKIAIKEGRYKQKVLDDIVELGLQAYTERQSHNATA